MLGRACAVICVLILASVSVQCDENESRVVQLAQGAVRGYKQPGEDLFVFYNIPYATAPTGRHKFKAPLPPPMWTDTLEAVDKGIICPQSKMRPFENRTEDESCLIATVYVPYTEETNLPVLVIVHGGAYQAGWGDMYTPIQLIKNKNIITFTFNYRHGAHGFLCLGTENAPGNAGMKDQVALLRWVKANIKNFGGNPEDVTISGFSAGSSAVDLLMLSESTNGLFNKVIAESGASLNAFSVQTDPISLAKELAKELNFENVDDLDALEEFYTTASIDLLTSSSFVRRDSTFGFSPCVEHDVGEEVFLADAPINILKSGKYNKVPILYGFSNLEGLYRSPLFNEWKDEMNQNYSDFLPADLNFDNNTQKQEIAQRIKEFYFGDSPVSDETALAYVNYYIDVVFAYGMLRVIQLHIEAGHNQIYLYEYSYAPEDIPLWRNLKGADHCAQTAAIYDGHLIYDEEQLSENYLKVKRVLRELWMNFIKTGAPVPAGSDLPAWPPVASAWSPHMSLDEELQLRGSLLQERTQFWNHIYQQHYRAPSPPPPQPSKAFSLRGGGFYVFVLIISMNVIYLYNTSN